MLAFAAALAGGCTSGPRPITGDEIRDLLVDALRGDPITDLVLREAGPDHFVGTGSYRGTPNLVVAVTVHDHAIAYDVHTGEGAALGGFVAKYSAQGELPMPANRTRQQK